MPAVTRHIAKPDKGNGSVRTLVGKRWTEAELQDASRRRSWERLVETMPRVTENTYRENAGRSSLTIEPAEGSFDDVFALLESHPKTFIEYDVDEFVGLDDDGEKQTPGPATIVKTLKREAVARGLLIGEQSVEGDDGERRTDVFRVCLRGDASNVSKLPKWWIETAQNLNVEIPEGPSLPEGFEHLRKVETVDVEDVETVEVE